MDKTLQQKTQSPIELSSSNYWMEIEEFTKTGKIPQELGDILKAVVNSHIKETIPCIASRRLIDLAKKYLMDGIKVKYSDMDRFYNIRFYNMMVFVPNIEEGEVLRSFFLLVPKYNGGKLKYLDEI